jgi:hypothetical protein
MASRVFRSCTATLRLIPLPPKPGTMPHLSICGRGQRHGFTPFGFSARPVGTHLALHYIGWCPSIACIKEQRSDVDRSLVELGVKVAWPAITQQGFHSPRRVRHTCRQSWAIQPLTGMRFRESNYLRLGRTSREAISALRHMDRRPPSPDDWNRGRTP